MPSAAATRQHRHPHFSTASHCCRGQATSSLSIAWPGSCHGRRARGGDAAASWRPLVPGGDALLRPAPAAAGQSVAVASVDGRCAIAATAEDFVCATLDWWPPDKCDYGTCAWGHAGLLNLVSENLSPITLRFSQAYASCLSSLLHARGACRISPAQCRQRRRPTDRSIDAVALVHYIDVPSRRSFTAFSQFGSPNRTYCQDQAKSTECLGPGRDTHLIEKILDPSTLDGMISTFSNLQGILKSAGTSAVAWVGEAGGAYSSGQHLVTDAFVFSFWYLDQLGMSAKYDTKSYCRQSLIGGNYGLLNTTTFQPNPDYYSGTNKIRAYAHCARDSPGITLLLINLSGNTTTQVSVTTQGAAAAHKHSAMKHVGRKFRHVHFHAHAHGFAGSAVAAGAMRDEYHLTPKDANLQSQVMLLNGKALATDPAGNIPRLEAVKVDAAQPIAVAPYCIVFARISLFNAPACS
ncbi:LOW QUALITY PROTEIN: hypothetical protein U9M48_027052 [Paspalum notatum var. saurae]|uniref:Heparanase-like protein 3 n=1 Tax=Paspalum notatum var. saurae TaxID=547442 RepID=A0AAQ3TU03_PASNO